jgi:hypothetical protein
MIERRMELVKDLFIPIIPKTHDIIETELSALCNRFIEEWIIESLKVSPIHILARDNWCLALAQNHRGIEILMQLTTKPSFQIFCLLILIHIFCPSICEGHGLLEIISAHLNGIPIWNLWASKLGIDWISSLIC